VFDHAPFSAAEQLDHGAVPLARAELVHELRDLVLGDELAAGFCAARKARVSASLLPVFCTMRCTVPSVIGEST